MHERRLLRGLPTTGIAVAGVVLGHWLAYIAADPHPAARTILLQETGHGYWTWAVKLAVVTGMAGAGTLALRTACRTAPPTESRAGSFAWLAWRLSALQILAFTSMEIAERAIAGAPLEALFGHLYLVGLAAQFLVACAGALVLLLLRRAVLEVIGRLREKVRPEPGIDQPLRRATPFFLRPRPELNATGVRGPPPR
jgi:hypothetical protein